MSLGLSFQYFVDATVNDECLEPDGLSGNPNFVIKNQLECLCMAWSKR